MSADVQELFAALAAPFPAESIKMLPKGGRNFAHISARTAMNRLDDVLGPQNWWDEYEAKEHSVLCRLTIRFEGQGGEVFQITKCDAGAYAGMADSGDDDKSGYSDAFKRAAVKFGVGRYLYGDGVPEFAGGLSIASPSTGGSRQTSSAPAQRSNAQPQSSRGAGSPSGNGGEFNLFVAPKVSRGLFPWIKKLEEHFGTQILNHVNKMAAEMALPRNFGDFNDEQKTMTSLRIIAFCEKLKNYKGEFKPFIDEMAGSPGGSEAQEEAASHDDIPF
jgi:hypothetical protein